MTKEKDNLLTKIKAPETLINGQSGEGKEAAITKRNFELNFFWAEVMADYIKEELQLKMSKRKLAYHIGYILADRFYWSKEDKIDYIYKHITNKKGLDEKYAKEIIEYAIFEKKFVF